MLNAENLAEIWSPFLEYLKNMEKELQCPLCFNLLVMPTLLPCDHMLCSDCITLLTKKGLICPSCKSSFCQKDARPVMHMGKIVSLFKEMDSSLGDMLQMPSSFFPLPDNQQEAYSAPAARENQDSFFFNYDHGAEYNNKAAVSKKGETLPQILNGARVSNAVKQRNLTNIKQPLNESSTSFGDECEFCHSFRTTEESGRMLCYINGTLVAPEEAKQSDAINVHEKCVIWAPQVYFDGDIVKNLEVELKRASNIRCRKCGLKGAALGCFSNKCQKSFHVPCAVGIPDCRWDCVNLHMLCPSHASDRLPCDEVLPEEEVEEDDEVEDDNSPSVEIVEIPSSPEKQIAENQSNRLHAAVLGVKSNILCVGSALSQSEKKLLDKFVSWAGGAVCERWRHDVTHVIASTNENGACKRTHQVLLAIATGKWILTTKWIEACLEAGHHVPEEPYEVDLDLDGCKHGPRKGRLRVIEKGAKFFLGMSFCFSKHFTLKYRQCLTELAVAAGGTIFKDMRSRGLNSDSSAVYFVYSEIKPQECESNDLSEIKEKRCSEAEEMTKKVGALVVGHTKFLNAIADSDIQHLKQAVVNSEV